MDLQDAYSYELNPRSYTECEEPNVSLQRRLGEDMDSCAFTHGTLMRACDIEEKQREAPEAPEAPEVEKEMRPMSPVVYDEPAAFQPMTDEPVYAMPDAKETVENVWSRKLPGSMPSAYILLIVAIVAVLAFALMRKRA
jgi:hypothetical protein